MLTHPWWIKVSVVSQMKKGLVIVVPSQFSLQRELVKQIQAVECNGGLGLLMRGREPPHSRQLHPMLARLSQRPTT